jgi:hypothetical protein
MIQHMWDLTQLTGAVAVHAFLLYLKYTGHSGAVLRHEIATLVQGGLA